eukprot:Nitzschia sp. Nitz4//scaffold10_size219509//74160//75449//NITZ4_001418-RA/size219509-processed-gene-0.125-mRNA-1//-1//CDS//3329532890//1681//frame0
MLPTPSRLLTLRDITSSLTSWSEDKASLQATTPTRVATMAQHASDKAPFTDEEVEGVCNSIRNMIPEKEASIDFEAVQKLLKEVAHLSHKNWQVTDENSEKLGKVLQLYPDSDKEPPLSTQHAKQLLERIMNEGNWQGAVHNAPPGSDHRQPWAVLVTGVNGIRKTTSLYQPWFDQLLSEALITPETEDLTNKPKNLPTGNNSFFRQLDHMICTLTNQEFARLYAWAAAEMSKSDDKDTEPSDEIVHQYSEYKAAIFSRYRTLSELLGAFLLKEAQKVKCNCLAETSGRDVAMFHYIDHFFGADSKYNKLALHFTINDLDCAKKSVDQRMTQEILDGTKAIQTKGENTSDTVFNIVYANAGGPYGSQVLQGVQTDSDAVWESEVMSGKVGKDWYKATIAINAHPTEPWTAQAVKPDGTLGTKFTFEQRK